MSLGPADVRRLLGDNGLRPSRALGQHFVTDPNTVRRIVRLAGVGPTSRVVEIGAGLGSLTLALADTGARVVAVEIDRHLVPVLETVVGGLPNVTVVQGDARALRWPAVLGDADGDADADADAWQLVANLPYNVATGLVVQVLEDVPAVTSMLVMVQREVAERLAAGPGGRAYGAVSVMIAYWATAALAGTVPPTVFHPRPAVDSALVRIERRAEVAVDPATVSYARLRAVVRAGFSQRRKTLRRALAGVVEPAAFALAGVSPQARAEELDVTQWGRLAAASGTGAALAAGG